jgi:uncharacterized protein YbjT (DUF2867 family)
MRIAVAGATGTVGRHVVAVAGERGHEAVSLSRTSGVDLTTGAGLADRLEAVDAVIDVSSIRTQSAKVSAEFFGIVTATLLNAEEAAGVRHHIALSIVGSDTAPFGYYAGKVRQEETVQAGRIPWTILRATQFHEFAEQLYGQFTVGPVHLVPKMQSQPVAAREVAQRLVTIAENGPEGHATDLAGPEVLRMAEMVEAFAAASGEGGSILEFPLPGRFGRALRDGTLLATPGADLGTQTFAEWIAQVAATGPAAVGGTS